MTWSPGFTLVTPAPTSRTTPAPSWPRIDGNRPSLSSPSSVYASVWQMPVAMISTNTSPAFGPSRSTSTISSGCLGAKATAARVFIVQLSPDVSRLCLQEPPYPTADALIVVRRVERSDRRVGLVHPVVAHLDQRLGESRREFRMELERDCRPVGPSECSVGREARRGDDVGIRRLHHDLVLVGR